MNPDLVLEVPDTPDRISRSIEILPNPRIGDHRFRRPNLSLKHRNSSNTREEESSLSINQNTSTAPNNNNERKRKSPIDLTSGESSNSDRNKKGKGVMQEREGTRVGPIARDNKGKGKMNPNNEAMREKSPTTVQSGTPRRVGQRWLVRNGCIAPSNIAKRNTEMQPTTGGSSNGETGEDATAQKASVVETEAGRNTRIQLPASGVSRQTGGHGPSRQTGGPGPSRHPVGPGPSRQPSEPGPSRHTRGPGSRIERRPEDPRINEIVAGSLYEGPSSRSKPLANNNATTSTPTNGWRTTANRRPGPSNPAATAGSSRAATSPTREALRNRLARPSLRGSSRGRRVRSSGASSSSNPTRNQVVTDLTTPPPTRGRVVGVRISEPEPVIDLDAMTTPGSSSNSGLARARQMAHDEWLARQLQDEFNTETQVPSSLFSMEEIDARIAMSLQQEENARRATAASVSPARGGGRTASRAARGRVRGRRGSGSNQIPLNLAMQMSLDFNADDYEALLALDENNHMHTGASSYQINNLPESVVRTDNFEEPCAVCLEKPAIGETIRHLPCLHKFHKDCIDMWLQRKKECPVCKCGINGTGLPA